MFLVLYKHMNILNNILQMWQRGGRCHLLYDATLHWSGLYGYLDTAYVTFTYSLIPICSTAWAHFSLWDSVRRFLPWSSLATTGRPSIQDVLTYHSWGSQSVLLFKTALRLRFIPNGQFITCFSDTKENSQEKST